MPHVVIIGGGFGGLTAARKLKNAPVGITVIDRRNHHLFQPLLYQVATAGLSPADIAYPIRSVLRGQSNVEVLLGEVSGIDAGRRVVTLDGRTLYYDYLIVATGTEQSYFGHEEWEKFAPGLKSISNATEVRRKILLAFEAAEMETDSEKKRALLTFVLVGAGPTGVEMAGAIAELSHQALRADFRHIDPQSTRIVLVEAGPRILATFPATLSERAQVKLAKLGVEVRVGGRVERIDEDGVIVSGTRVHSRTVIWTAGVSASPAGKWLGAEMDRAGRVRVQPDLSVAGHPEIFVIGDTALVVQDGKPVPGVAPAAMQEARYVAQTIRRAVAGKTERAPFRYRDKGNLATVGRAFAIADFGKMRLYGFLAWILWLVVHIFYLIGFRNRVVVMLEWAWAYLTFQRGARLIVTDR
ncbi:MAG: NAD(P)/FAD-dependent oxidoreductase [Bdellovibrionota bacterium]